MSVAELSKDANEEWSTNVTSIIDEHMYDSKLWDGEGLSLARRAEMMYDDTIVGERGTEFCEGGGAGMMMSLPTDMSKTKTKSMDGNMSGAELSTTYDDNSLRGRRAEIMSRAKLSMTYNDNSMREGRADIMIGA